jgi:hypothetical protein
MQAMSEDNIEERFHDAKKLLKMEQTAAGESFLPEPHIFKVEWPSVRQEILQQDWNDEHFRKTAEVHPPAIYI